jgi:hypothetical protein
VAWFTVCPIMYDPHGSGTSSGGVMNSSSVWALTAGGTDHNSDNSYDNGNRCLRSTFPIPPPGSPSITPSPTPEPTTGTPATTPAGSGKGTTKTTGTGSGKVTTKTNNGPLLRWTAIRGASYYNFQLYRNGKKILNIWPTHASVQLTRSWRFNGRWYWLTPGRYAWYVWPGFGRAAARRYGRAIGHHTLVITRLP